MKIMIVFFVILDIALEFWKPILLSSLGNVGTYTPIVPMPKTSMNENNSMILWKDNIRFSRERSNIISEAESF